MILVSDLPRVSRNCNKFLVVRDCFASIGSGSVADRYQHEKSRTWQILSAIAATVKRPLDVAEAKEMIARRGGFSESIEMDSAASAVRIPMAYTDCISCFLVHVNLSEKQHYMSTMEDKHISSHDLAHLVRLALAGKPKDAQLFVRRLINRYRLEVPELADQLGVLLT